jgi:radical SAM protein (TIGR01212 family)
LFSVNFLIELPILQRLHSRINMIGPWLRREFGVSLRKIGLDLGLGCPRRCLYCADSGSGPGVELPLEEQLRRGMASRSADGRRFLAYFQGHTSTNAPAACLEEPFRRAAAFPGVAGLIISTRPDCLRPEHWRLLSRLRAQGHLLWLELGLQSAHDQTLARIGRGHDAACFAQAAATARRLGIALVAHVILGLPGEDSGHTRATAVFLRDLKVWGVKLHSLMVLEGSPWAALWRSGRLGPLWSREQWAQAVAEFIRVLPPTMTVHRLSADPGRDICLAPSWIGDKNGALKFLAEYLESKNIRQGDLSF